MTGDKMILQDLFDSQGELVGSITHDLKGLLTGLEGGLYLIQSGMEKNKPERLQQGTDTLRRNLARMRRTVVSALYYVKDREPNNMAVELRELLEGVRKEMSTHAATLGVELKVLAEDRSVTGDHLALHSIIVDLTEYALDSCHSARQLDAPSVEVHAATRGEGLAIEITARGFQIDDEVKKQVLGAPYSPRESDRAHLWLFIAHKVIKVLGGTLEISLDPERAMTRFGVLLPAPRA